MLCAQKVPSHLRKRQCVSLRETLVSWEWVDTPFLLSLRNTTNTLVTIELNERVSSLWVRQYKSLIVVIHVRQRNWNKTFTIGSTEKLLLRKNYILTWQVFTTVSCLSKDIYDVGSGFHIRVVHFSSPLLLVVVTFVSSPLILVGIDSFIYLFLGCQKSCLCVFS